jgi:quercetin 2,3-dioxygenase
MMMHVRKSSERGRVNHGWLDARHTFSFGRYHDPEFMGFRALRVINQDIVAPGMGFGTHGHDNMEIITYVLRGTLRHQDSLGSQGDLTPGQVQRMSAGAGIRHSEFNPSKDQSLELLQIWIEPDVQDARPEYEQREFPELQTPGSLHLLVGPRMPSDGEAGAPIRMNADVRVLAGRLARGHVTKLGLRPGRHAWVQVVRGEVEVNGTVLSAGDAAAIKQESSVTLAGIQDAEVLVFDLA